MEYFLILILICLVFILIFAGIKFYNIVFRGFAPFVSTRFKAILGILKEMDLNGDEHVYELGAGKAGFLRAVEQKFRNLELTGVEYSWWPYILARIQVILSGSRIKLVRKNIFKVNLKDADVIYCFLSDTMMKKLEKKIKEECRPNTMVISYNFPFPNIESEKVIKEGKDNIYFYRI
jgi:16S rRNA A1518/A1519 N6-dimethyltransferase RsmA/KsgA/DIM1 with predicted DNA glycosylase/AP lyase activity